MPDRKNRIRGDDPRFHQPIMRNDCRALDVRHNGKIVVWQWKTNGQTVILYDPASRRREIPVCELYGCPEQDWNWDESFTITPRDLIEYIKEHYME